MTSHHTAPDTGALEPLTSGWARRMPKDERIFMWLIIGSVVFMSVFSIGWLFVSDHNVPTNTKATTPEAWEKKVASFTATHQVEPGVVRVPPGEDAYIMAQQYQFSPELILTKGETYTIWVSSKDVLHGFSLVGHGKHLNFQIAPGFAYGLELTPDKTGTYLIVCNEYCGQAGHHMMSGKIHVEEGGPDHGHRG